MTDNTPVPSEPALKRFGLILVALLALRLALMAFVPVFEPSEARYAAIAANMARTGDFVIPHYTYRNTYQSFDGKPPLVFQAGGLCCSVLGTEHPVSLQLGVRLFPLFSVVVLLFILYFTERRFAGEEGARLAVFVCATSTAFYSVSGMCFSDLPLTCCAVGALLLYRVFAERPTLPLAAGVAALLGTGMIAKGPVALALFGVPVLVDAIANRRWKAVFNWRWLAVAPVFFAIAVPWFVLAERRNPGCAWYFFYNENFLRFITHEYGDRYGEGREAFRGVSVLWALLVTLPWVLLPVWTAIRRPSSLRAVAWRSFPVLAILAIVGFWGLTSRVLLYYLFPVVPFFAAALAESDDRARLCRFAPWFAGATAVALTAVLTFLTFTSDRMLGAATPFAWNDNHYAYELYHGTPSPEKLAEAREKAAAWQRACDAWQRRKDLEKRPR